MNDTELQNITPFLKNLSKVEDVRSVEKRYAEFTKNEASQANGSGSISTKGLGDKTYETKLIQVLNDQYKHKARNSEDEVYDQTSFENIDEGTIDQNDLLQKKDALANEGKQVFFQMVRSSSPKIGFSQKSLQTIEQPSVIRNYCQKAVQSETDAQVNSVCSP